MTDRSALSNLNPFLDTHQESARKKLPTADTVIGRLKEMGIERAARAVCREHGHNLEAVMAHKSSRSRAKSIARRRVWKLTSDTFPDLSAGELGDIFGRDHSSILYGLRKAEAEAEARVGRGWAA
jgi:chromosomal replication initiation ATPase DnaA